jgi:hypothetical protein
MAENKKSFIAYVDWKDTFNALPDDKAGQLVKYLFAYVNDENPSSDDVLINAVFANIKQTLKRDLRKYEIIREKRSLAGRVSADKRQQVLTCVDKPQQTSTNSTVIDSVNDSVNVSEEKRKIDFEIFRLQYPGVKRGFETEYENFKKKHKDWKEVIVHLQGCLTYQMEKRYEKKTLNQFVPEWKNLQTWINQRCWEDEMIIQKKEIDIIPKFTRGPGK